MQVHIDQSSNKMEKALEALQGNFDTVRTGRANPSLVSEIMVPYYGADTPLNQMAQISVIEGKTLMIKPFDPQILKDIEKALFNANIGLTPQNDGQVIRLNVPSLTEETRKELSKKVSKLAEDAKVAIRNVRRDINDQIKKDDTLTEDDEKKALDKVQKLTDDFIKRVDEAAAIKTKEIMTV